MPTKVNRQTVDLSRYPNLVVIYLGMRVNRLMGLKTLFGFGPKISASVDAQPDGLLLHENFLFSLFPPHAGMRQYRRDMERSLGRGQSRLGSAGSRSCGLQGTSIWQETYLMCLAWKPSTTMYLSRSAS